MQNRQTPLAILFLAISLFILTSCASASYQNETADFSTRIDTLCQEYKLNGSIIVSNNGEIILSKGYGFADFESKLPNDSKTVYGIGSVTKQFTSAAILMLEQQNALSVDDTLDMFIPDYPDGHLITIHHLLSQTSGIVEHGTQEWFDRAGYRYHSFEELIDLFKHQPLNFTPGEQAEYSNSNYILLGYIIEKASGLGYGVFLNQHIFDVLNMHDTKTWDNTPNSKKALSYRKLEDGTFEAYTPLEIKTAASTGGIESTVEDLYKWSESLYTDEILSAESKQKRYTPNEEIYPDFPYGYGVFILGPLERGHYYHGGEINGYFSSFDRKTKAKDTIIILTNTLEREKVWELRQQIHNVIAEDNLK